MQENGIDVQGMNFNREWYVEKDGQRYKRVDTENGRKYWLQRQEIEGEYGWQVVNLALAEELERGFQERMSKLTEVN